jgi:hypothetical protein
MLPVIRSLHARRPSAAQVWLSRQPIVRAGECVTRQGIEVWGGRSRGTMVHRVSSSQTNPPIADPGSVPPRGARPPPHRRRSPDSLAGFPPSRLSGWGLLACHPDRAERENDRFLTSLNRDITSSLENSACERAKVESRILGYKPMP